MPPGLICPSEILDDSRMSRRSSLVWWALLAGVLYVGAFTLLSVGGAFRRGWVVWVAVALLVAAAILLQLTLSRARKQGLLSRPVRLWVAIGIMVLGAVLGLVWWFAKLSGGWGLCSLCALYLGAGQVLAEIRSRTGARLGGVPCGLRAVSCCSPSV